MIVRTLDAHEVEPGDRLLGAAHTEVASVSFEEMRWTLAADDGQTITTVPWAGRVQVIR